MNRLAIYFLTGLLAAFLLYVAIQGLPDYGISTSLAAEANNFYRLGETATNVAERKRAFNHALETYLALEKPEYGNGKLFYNIGNTYYQLDEVPLAIYYYYRAQELAPRDPAIEHNLSQALHKLNMEPQQKRWPTSLSLSERLCLFFWTTILLTVAASFYIWTRKAWLKRALIVLGALALAMLVSLFYSRYISSQEAVMVKASMLYRDAGTQYATVTKEPLKAGVKVDVIDIKESGSWIKILSPDGSLGYVASESVKLL